MKRRKGYLKALGCFSFITHGAPMRLVCACLQQGAPAVARAWLQNLLYSPFSP